MAETTSEQLATTSRQGHVGTITLTRKGNNSIAGDLGGALVSALEELEGDPEIRCVVIRSGYEKYFSVGADLGDMMSSVDRDDKEGMKKALADTVGYIQECFTRLEKSRLITIAAIKGHALGGGCELALSCDYRLMVDDGRASIGQTEVNLGIIPGAGGTQRLPRLIGPGKALEMMLEGTRVTAPEAARLGLINAAIKPEEFDAAVTAKAETLAAGAPIAQALIKKAVHEGMGKETIEAALAVEMDGFVKSAMSDDAAIGIISFLSKQKPEFTGK
ncbi:MAG: hypothetical protein NVS3B24_05410 [Candidatus Dormibacteria bacterium]